jgi:hypothetical protein
MKAELLAKNCRETASLGDQAIKWLSDEKNVETVGRVRESLIRSMRLTSMRALRLEKAALRPMCVGIFGPSQAGKSYLVEVLARPETGKLRARFDGVEPLDFLQDINPVGEKESTGLVTRFTIRPPESRAPTGFPVRLRLLTEADIVKIIGNTFFLDGDQTKEDVPTAEDVSKALGAVKSVGSARTGVFDENSILDLQEYFQKHFVGARYLDALPQFWGEAQRLASKLDLDGRVALFSLLWGKHPELSRLYHDLAFALQQLGCPEEAFCSIEALVPREGSIIDIATLNGLGKPSEDFLPVVSSQNGSQVNLPRPVLAALTAELRIEIAENPRPLFKETDLVDFPGARSRQKVHLSDFLEQNPNALKELFLRGKVAYLFDRYVAEQELTSMLLCIRPSNQEVVTLPDLIDNWIVLTHGRTPEARRNRPNLLFVVLTWFDMHFVDKAGDVGQELGLRFRNRLEASLLDFFGKAHAWPRNWTPGEPFGNCYWFRNPNYPAEAIIRYEGQKEVEFLPEKKERIAELRREFLSIPEASAHFRDPAKAFDEALRLNDGGASYLMQNLEGVCRPELKLQQVAASLADLRRDLQAQLSRFYVPLDLSKRLQERRAAADRVLDALEDAVVDGTFGMLMRSLLMDPSDLTEIIFGHLRGVAGPEQQKDLAPSAFRTKEAGLIKRPGIRGQALLPSAKLDRERLLARAAVAAWIDRLREASENETRSRLLGISSDVLKDLVAEVLDLINRADLESRIASDLSKLMAIERPEESSAKIALIASIHMNRLLCDLGFSLVPRDQRPKVEDGNGGRVAFDFRPIVFDARGIGAIPKPFATTYATDWFHGFYQVVEDNVTSEKGLRVDLVQNELLKTILDALEVNLAI